MSGELRDRSYLIPEENTQTVEEIIDRIYEEFETKIGKEKFYNLEKLAIFFNNLRIKFDSFFFYS